MIDFLKRNATLIFNVMLSCGLAIGAVFMVLEFGGGVQEVLLAFMGFAAGVQVSYTVFDRAYKDLLSSYKKSLDREEETLIENRDLLKERAEMLNSNPFLDDRNNYIAEVLARQVQDSKYIN